MPMHGGGALAQVERGLKVNDRFTSAAGAGQGAAEIVVEAGILGIGRERFFQMRKGRKGLVRLDQRTPQLAPRNG